MSTPTEHDTEALAERGQIATALNNRAIQAEATA